VCSLGVGSSWHETLLPLILANARASCTGAGGSRGFPCAAAAWATPSAHIYHSLRSPPQQIHPSPNTAADERQETPLTNLSRGSLASPQKHFPPISSGKSWRAVKGWGQAFHLLPASRVSGACGLCTLLPSLRGQCIIHIL